MGRVEFGAKMCDDPDCNGLHPFIAITIKNIHGDDETRVLSAEWACPPEMARAQVKAIFDLLMTVEKKNITNYHEGKVSQ